MQHIIENLKSDIINQELWLAVNLSDAARVYYEDDWGAMERVSSSVAGPNYYKAYLNACPERQIRDLPPEFGDELNLGYMHIPENTLAALQYKIGTTQALINTYVLFIDYLIRLEGLLRIYNLEEQDLSKKIDHNLNILEKAIGDNLYVYDQVKKYLTNLPSIPSRTLLLDILEAKLERECIEPNNQPQSGTKTFIETTTTTPA